jgi:DNA invertase Pin-like site-specific DNA recombinase
MDAVAYLRVSTKKDEQAASIPTQREEVRKYAEKHGYRIIREYVDDGISGDETEKRVAFQRMLADAKARRDFVAVLCWDQDRFGRFDPLEAGYWIKPLRDAGVHLATVAQGRVNWDDFAGRIVYAVQQEGKHAFLEDLSRNALRGSLAAARRGEWCGGPTPYGLRVEGKRLVPGDPAEIEIVRYLFRAYAHEGVPAGSLATDLNGREVPAPGGGLWHKTTILKILDCPYYTGDFVWNRRRDGKYHTVRGGEITKERKAHKRESKPRQDWIFHPESHGAIVDRGTWERAQQRRIENKPLRTPHPHGGGFLFTRLVFCMECGSPMHGATCTSPHRNHQGQILSEKKHRYRRYICGKYNAHGKQGCKCNTVREQLLRDVVVCKLQEEFRDGVNLARLREEIGRQVLVRQEADPDLRRRLRTRIAELDRKLDHGNESYLEAPAHLRSGLAAKLDQWTRERDNLQNQLEALGPEVGPADCAALVERAIGQLTNLRDRLEVEEPALLRAVFREMVARIELWFDHVPYGKHRNGSQRERSILRQGLIHLRPDMLVNREVASGKPLTMVTPARTSPDASRAATRSP